MFYVHMNFTVCFHEHRKKNCVYSNIFLYTARKILLYTATKCCIRMYIRMLYNVLCSYTNFTIWLDHP